MTADSDAEVERVTERAVRWIDHGTGRKVTPDAVLRRHDRERPARRPHEPAFRTVPVASLNAGQLVKRGERWVSVHHVDRSHAGEAFRDTRVMLRDGNDIFEEWLPSGSDVEVMEVRAW